MRVVIVVPAFAERQNGDEPVIRRIIRRFKAAFAEQMRQRN